MRVRPIRRRQVRVVTSGEHDADGTLQHAPQPAAAFGVQSSRNRERDFSQGNYRHFIVAGVVFTALFVLTVIVVVRLVLRHAGM